MFSCAAITRSFAAFKVSISEAFNFTFFFRSDRKSFSAIFDCGPFHFDDGGGSGDATCASESFIVCVCVSSSAIVVNVGVFSFVITFCFLFLFLFNPSVILVSSDCETVLLLLLLSSRSVTNSTDTPNPANLAEENVPPFLVGAETLVGVNDSGGVDGAVIPSSSTSSPSPSSSSSSSSSVFARIASSSNSTLTFTASSNVEATSSQAMRSSERVCFISLVYVSFFAFTRSNFSRALVNHSFGFTFAKFVRISFIRSFFLSKFKILPAKNFAVTSSPTKTHTSHNLFKSNACVGCTNNPLSNAILANATSPRFVLNSPMRSQLDTSSGSIFTASE